MTTDRELLELAAKAAGMEGMKYVGGAGLGRMIDPSSRPEETGTFGLNWNPLTDDGDALRLAVKLALFFDDDFQVELGAIFRYPGDLCAATRRAIVRAAAATGAKP